ncbi:SboK [Streptococcus pneumoniae]|nr:SboK [Streptococcus pneumoniae]
MQLKSLGNNLFQGFICILLHQFTYSDFRCYYSQSKQEWDKIIPFFKDILIHILNQEIWNDFEFDYDYSLVNQSIMIEKFLITRVIHNIIYNSVLHNEKGCTIRINLFKKDTNVIVEIKDNGQGASPEKIAELNELSFKNIDISKIRTTGIGLKISKQIVDLHQGSISFASVQNEFFESIISLPIFNIRLVRNLVHFIIDDGTN